MDLTDRGVQIDHQRPGDLLDLSIRTRQRLDAAGRGEVIIVASGGLDEYEVKRLLDGVAPIDVFGVGTKVGVSADAPSLDSAYKLVELDGRPLMKLSQGKQTMPGPKQVYRHRTAPDLIATRDESPPPGCSPLLVPVMRGGSRVAPIEPVEAARNRLSADLDWLAPDARRIDGEQCVPLTTVSSLLQVLTDETKAALSR